MVDIGSKRPSRWQAYLSCVRGWIFCRRKVLLVVMWAARLIWRVYKLLLRDDPWSFYAFRMETKDATRGAPAGARLP